MSLWSAGRYEAVAQQISPIAARVVDTAGRLRPLPGADVVDLACGTGSAALTAAAAGATVTGVDLTPELLAIAADKPGGDAVHWVAADAAATGLPDAAFDIVVSNMGTIFVEPVSLVAEVTRLLRPGGVFGFSTWVRDADNPFYNPIIDVLGPRPAADHSPDQWGEADVITTRLSEDFGEIFIENDSHAWTFESLEQAVRFITDESPMHVDVLARLDEPTRTRLIEAFRAALDSYARVDGTIGFQASYAVVAAVRHPA
ncbi:class I SAM-dependent methyltransferase [Mycolicibacterium bacteremicum]|uniref:class I SAM-dependent methyltransferase n=1 Tax=Mycolicibacterium bacteremicum TaxID=564198 RepID=UPI0026ECBBB6|nr:methyltransferase domain-containing protein [Mycolicibacterium bacteremicum]